MMNSPLFRYVDGTVLPIAALERDSFSLQGQSAFPMDRLPLFEQ